MYSLKRKLPFQFLICLSFLIFASACKSDDDNTSGGVKNAELGPVSIEFIIHYPFSNYPSFYDATKTTSGAYALCGQLYSSPDKGFVVLTESDGKLIGRAVINSDSLDIAAISVVETQDKGFLVLCAHNLTINRNIILVKLDKSGNEVWRKDYVGSVSFNGTDKILRNANNTYTICGNTGAKIDDKNMYLLTVNEHGDSLSSQEFNNGNNEACNTAMITRDGGYLLAGTGTRYNNKMVVKKVSNSNTEVFTKTFTERFSTNVFSVTEDALNNLYVLASNQDGPVHSMALYKLGSQGKTLFFKEYLSGNSFIYPRHVFLSSRNELLITSSQQDSILKTSLIRMNLSGEVIATEEIEYFEGYKTFEDAKGDLFITGTKGGEISIMKLAY